MEQNNTNPSKAVDNFGTYILKKANGMTLIDDCYNFSDVRKLIIPEYISDVQLLINNEFPNLNSIEISPDNPFFESKSNAIFKRNTNTLIFGCGSTIVPFGTKEIDQMAFYKAFVSKKDNFVVPNSVSKIGVNAFSACHGLSSISLSSKLVNLEVGAFINCQNLKEIKIPVGIKHLKSLTFYGCTFLSSIDLPEGLLSIEENCFLGCISLAKLWIPKTVHHIDKNALPPLTKYIYLESDTEPDGLSKAIKTSHCKPHIKYGCSKIQIDN